MADIGIAIPLRVHSHFSLLRAMPDVTSLAQRAAADGLTALALTDHAALYGAVAFARACRQVGIRPITGLTIRLAPPPDAWGAPDSGGVIVLLARHPGGYRSLCPLRAWLEGTAAREARVARRAALGRIGPTHRGPHRPRRRAGRSGLALSAARG